MNSLTNNSIVRVDGYSTPSIDLYEVKVEAGFEASMPGVTINPWESDDDSLIL